MAEQSELYKWFWRKMGEMTESRPLTAKQIVENNSAQALQRFERLRANIDTLNDFLSEAKKLIEELERAGANVAWPKSFVAKLLGPVNILNLAIGASGDAIEAAQQVSLDLATWYKQAADQARAQSGGDDDEYMIAAARIDRQWQMRNVKAVLSTDEKSFVMRLWPKWRDRLLRLVI